MAEDSSSNIGERLKINRNKSYSWKSESSSDIFKVSAALVPETHVLDAASNKLSSAPRIESDVFDLVGETVEDLPVEDHRLSCPVNHHDDLEIVTGQALTE